MKLHKFFLITFIIFAISSCSKEEETISTNDNYTAIQQKAMNILNGTWISNEIRVQYRQYEEITINLLVASADTLIFHSQYPEPKTVFSYNYLLGEETENFDICGTCELRTSISFANFNTQSNTYNCYYYISPSGDTLQLYNIESKLPVKSFDFRVESATSFFAGTYNGIPIIFNKQQ